MAKKTNVTKQYEEQNLASIWSMKFKEAMVHKAEEVKKWQTYMDAYKGEYFKNISKPDYKSDMVANHIFSIVETIRPIMLDNDPKFMSMPRQPEGLQFANDLQEALSYEWDRELMNEKMYRELIHVLVYGTAVFHLKWEKRNNNIKAVPVSPFNIFPDPLATCVEDARYIMYADYVDQNVLKDKYPNKADKLSGSQINYGELVNDNNRNTRIDDQVLVVEAWCMDYETYEEKDNGKVELKYPKGRVIKFCPELGVVLEDKGSAYNDGKLPFITLKDYDIPGKFWGEGEVAQLLSPQKHMNDLNNAVIDNAKATANMPWIVDKNSGVGVGKITARPGLIIRKNPGTEVRRDQAPSMPNYVVNAIETFKSDLEHISGIFSSTKGDSATGVYTAQGILALQEAGQTRIRLKVKLLENSLGKLAEMWYSRMKQFWKEDRWIRLVKFDGTYDLKKFTKTVLDYDYDIRITAGSTMPVNRGAMLDLMIRLAQTPMPDGQMLVDREAVSEYLPEEVKSAMLRRMGNKQAQLEELQQGIQQIAQQIEEVRATSDENDEQIFGVVEDMTKALEDIKKQILQVEEEHAKLEEEKKKEEQENKIKHEAYNKGYTDAEKLLAKEEEPEDLEDQEGLDGGLPEEILKGLEELSDEELAILIESNPELIDLIQ